MRLINVEIEIKKTISSIYFLPIMNKSLKFKFLPQLENSYFFNNNNDKHFSVLYKFKGTKEFLKYEEEIFKHELFIGHEDYDEYVLYKFKIPKEYVKYIDIINKGRCPSFDEDAKKSIILFARRRLFEEIDEINDLIHGKGTIPIPDIKDETFFNHLISKESFLDANDLYKKRKNNE